MVIVHVLTMLRVEVDTDDEEAAPKMAENIVNEWGKAGTGRPDIYVDEIWEGRSNLGVRSTVIG